MVLWLDHRQLPGRCTLSSHGSCQEADTLQTPRGQLPGSWSLKGSSLRILWFMARYRELHCQLLGSGGSWLGAREGMMLHMAVVVMDCPLLGGWLLLVVLVVLIALVMQLACAATRGSTAVRHGVGRFLRVQQQQVGAGWGVVRLQGRWWIVLMVLMALLLGVTNVLVVMVVMVSVLVVVCVLEGRALQVARYR